MANFSACRANGIPTIVTVRRIALTKLASIVKVDKATGQPLAGAHLEVKNEQGEVIADYVSTEDPYVIKE